MPRRSSVAVGVLAALALSACSTDQPATTASARAGTDPGVEHIHGLGVDPADGVLYAASHYGLFRVPAQGTATRVAERRQDTMGFTVVGPNTFLGSGHPDHDQDRGLPAQLGLIRSTDAANSWQVVSLGGETDFHALHAAHGSVFGWDAGTGRLMVSGDDGRTWDTRSRLALRDFAISPADPNILLATTQQGLVRSTDGARTWQAVPGAPLIAVLAWVEPAALLGITPDGTVQHSPDSGRTWTARGNAGGQPEAVTIDTRQGTSTLFVAVSDRGIVASTDDGRTFATRYAE